VSADHCEFGRMSFGNWLRCSACLHTKAGFLLVVAGGLLMGVGIPGIPASAGWGKILLAAGALLLIYSLIKDLLCLIRRNKHRGPEDPKPLQH
jgi:hypothetical protein